MRHLFLPGADLRAETLRIEGPDHHHLVHVLRVRPCDMLTLLDDAGSAVRARITSVEKRHLTVRVSGPAETAPEPPVHITVAQALGKGDRFEQVVQHATEAGACGFLPLLTERAVARLADGREAEAKRARWRLIAKGAAEQAGRACIPAVAPPATLDDLSRRFADYAGVMLLHPEGDGLAEALAERLAPARSLDRRPALLLLVGPEGGFSPREVETARAAGARVASLGPHTLRTETAALVAVSQILFGLAALGYPQAAIQARGPAALAPGPLAGESL